MSAQHQNLKSSVLPLSFWLLTSLVSLTFCPLSLPVYPQTVEPNQYRADLLLNLGSRQIINGQFADALQSVRESLTIYQKIQNRQGEANALGKLGEIHFTRGEYQEAIIAYEQSLTILASLHNQSNEVQILEQLSNAYLNIGDAKKAKELRDRAAIIRREIGNPKKEAAFLSNVGLHHAAQREYQQSLAVYLQQLAVAQKNGDTSMQINSLENLGITYRQLRQYPQAIATYQQQLELARKLGNKTLEADTLNALAATYTTQGNFTQAIAFYQQQLELAEKSGDTSRKANLLKLLGQAYSASGQHEQAMKLYQQQLATATATQNLMEQGTALNNLAFAFLKDAKFNDAQATLQESIKIWQSLRQKLDNQEDYTAEQSNTYRLLQQLMVAQNQPEAALEMAERERIMTFLKLLGMRLPSDSVATNLKVAPAQLTPPTINDIKVIASKEKATLVKYTLSYDGEIYVWVVPPSGKITFRQINPKLQNTIYPVNSLAEVVADIPASLGVNRVEGKNQEYQPLLQLHQLLIKPIADLLPKNPQERLIFIGQDELLLIPFPALVDISGKYLIEKHTISIAPAIQVLKLAQKQRGKTGGSKNVVVGNPTMPNINRGIGTPPQPLPPLVNAEQEALVIADLLKTQAIVGNQATKAAILPLLPKAKRIHLATYGILDDIKRQGIPGAIALAPGGNDNGLLTASEILNLYTQPKGERLRAHLIVLSAGDLGQNHNNGTGIIGLSLALINAGVPSIVISHWVVTDSGNATLMSEFYRQLQSSSETAKALRTAMLVTMKQHPNPKNWAGFSLIGATR